MSDNVELLRCPFCGSAPKKVKTSLGERFWYADEVMYVCTGCRCSRGARGDTSNPGYADNSTVERRALEAWNTRAALSQQPTDAMLDEMRRRGLSIDGDNAYKRDLIDCIIGALVCGKQNTNPPPAGHWAQQFWEIGRADGEIQEGYPIPSAPAPAAPAEQEPMVWISIEDRIPHDNQPVWCHGTYDGQHAPCGFEGLHRHGRWVALNNGDYIDGGYGDDYEAVVTHWMPLPAAPGAIPPAAEQPEAPGLPELLIALGCAGIAVSGGTHGDPWQITLPIAEQPDTLGALQAFTAADGREAFEAMCREQFRDITRDERPDPPLAWGYANSLTHDRWCGWSSACRHLRKAMLGKEAV